MKKVLCMLLTVVVIFSQSNLGYCAETNEGNDIMSTEIIAQHEYVINDDIKLNISNNEEISVGDDVVVTAELNDVSKNYEYCFDVSKVNNKRKRITKGGFKTKIEAQEAGTIAYEEYLRTGVVIKESQMSYYDYLDYWYENYCKVNLKYTTQEAYKNIIEKYNQRQEDNNHLENVINYNDIVGLLMSSVTSIVDMISYVLIGFVSISLVVSSIMIGIITYISVLERTKEIGILRAIGASKKDVSRVFKAETLIIGLTAGVIGIAVTIILNIPINIIINNLAGVSGLSKLPVAGAIILILISVILTMIAGLIPSKLASKKDPVESLRTE